LLNWDVLFLLPVPWWGPVLAPVLISVLLILWGTFSSQFEHRQQSRLSNLSVWVLNFAGVALALYVFMAGSITASHHGMEAIRVWLPEKFNWPLFCIAWVLMAAPAMQICWKSILRDRATFDANRATRNLDASTT
jgi:hypothetical protein